MGDEYTMIFIIWVNLLWLGWENGGWWYGRRM